MTYRVRLAAALMLLYVGSGYALGQTEQRVALVIGNGHYLTIGKLKNPANDAKAMAGLLRRAGFDVVELEDATRRDMVQAVRKFAEKLSPGGVGLFFYAGHGIQAQGINYLIPLDAALAVEDDLKYEAIDVQDVMAKLEDARVRLSLVILDACRDNPFSRSRGANRSGLIPIDATRGTFIAYSTAPGKVADDGDGVDSVYTAELLKAMSEPGRKLQDVFERVTDAVTLQTNNAQTPWTNSNFRGDFYFFGPTTLTITPPAADPGVPVATQEQAAWMAVANATTAGPFEAFLKQFPNGVFAGIARAKIEEMNAPKQPPVATIPAPQRPEAVPQQSAEEQELAAWPSVAGATTPEPLEGFLRRFPTGMFADIAKAKIAEMKAPQQLAAVAVPRPPMRVPDVVPGPNRTAALLQDARAYDHEGRFDRAIQALDEAIRMDPKNAVGFNNRGVVYLHKGEAVRAIQDFDEAVRIDPNNATASRNRAFAYRSAGTLPPPSQSQVVQQEGDAFFKMGQFDRAIQYYDEAIRLDPKNAVAFISRSNAYRNLGRSDRADQDIDRAGRIQSD